MMSDTELLEEVKRGKIKKYGEIVERYMKQAYSVALYFTGDTHLAWDVSQEAFLRVLKGIKKFDTSRPFFPYLYSVIKNLVTSMRRKREDYFEDIVVLVDDDPQKALEKMEEIESLKRAIDTLDKKDREIIFLRHFSNMSYKEISELLNIPIGSVMSRLYYARKKLMEKMKNE